MGSYNRHTLAKALGASINHSVIKSAWDAIARHQAGGATAGTIAVGGEPVQWRMTRQRGGAAPHVAATALPAFRAALASARAAVAGPDSYTRRTLAKILGVDAGYHIIKSAWDAIARQQAEGATVGTITVGGEPVQWRMTPSGNGTHPHVAATAIPAFRAALATARAAVAGPDYYTRHTLAKALGVSDNHSLIKTTWAAIATQRDAGADAGTITVGGEPVQWRMMPSGTGTYPHVGATAIPAFQAEIAAARKAASGPNSYNRHTLAKALGVSINHSVIKTAWATIARQQAGGATAGAITVGGEPVQWRMMPSGTGTYPHVDATAIPAFRAALAAIPYAVAGDLTRHGLMQALGVSDNHSLIKTTWAAIATQRDAGADAGTITVGGEPVQWRMLLARSRLTPHVDASALPAFRAAIGHAPKAGQSGKRQGSGPE